MKKGMSKKGLLSMLLLLLLVFSVTLYARPQNQGNRQDNERPQRGPMSIEDMTTELQELLSLSEEQTAQLKSILETHMEEVKSLHENSGEDREAMMSKMKEAQEKLEAAVMEILDKDQQETFKQYNEEKAAERESRRSRRD